MMQMKEQELRLREEKIDKDYQEFQRRKEEKARLQQEELFILDLEREREKRDKTGRTVMAK